MPTYAGAMQSDVAVGLGSLAPAGRGLGRGGCSLDVLWYCGLDFYCTIDSFSRTTHGGYRLI